MAFKFKVETPKRIEKLWKDYWFAGGSIIENEKGVSFCLGKMAGVKWPDEPYVYFKEMFHIMKEVFGLPSQFTTSDSKTSFRYIFKSNKHSKIYYEIYDYYGHMSCGIGRYMSFGYNTTGEEVNSINSELQELVNELVTMYQLMRRV